MSFCAICWNVVLFPSASFRAKGGGGTRESVPSVMAACQSNSGSHTIARAGGRTWGHKPFGTQGLHGTCLCIVTLYSHVLACPTTQVLNVLGAHFIASGDIPGPSGGAAAPPGPRDLLWVLQSTDHRCTMLHAHCHTAHLEPCRGRFEVRHGREDEAAAAPGQGCPQGGAGGRTDQQGLAPGCRGRLLLRRPTACHTDGAGDEPAREAGGCQEEQAAAGALRRGG